MIPLLSIPNQKPPNPSGLNVGQIQDDGVHPNKWMGIGHGFGATWHEGLKAVIIGADSAFGLIFEFET